MGQCSSLGSGWRISGSAPIPAIRRTWLNTAARPRTPVVWQSRVSRSTGGRCARRAQAIAGSGASCKAGALATRRGVKEEDRRPIRRRDAACYLKANGLFRRDRTIERTFLTLEVVLEVVDAFGGQSNEADRQDHPMGAAAGNPGRGKIALGVAERHPRPLRHNKKLGGRLVVLQAGRDLQVGLTPVSWRDESLGSSSLALRHVVLRFRGIL